MARRTVGLAVGALILALIAVVGAGARPARAAPNGLLFLAASSLTEVLPAVAARWTARGNPPITFSFDASSRLAKQVEAGAPADAFVSADEAWMDYLVQRDLIDRATRADLVGNTLVAVLPAASTAAVAGAADLARPGIARLGLGGETVPAGRYARAALRAADVEQALAGRIVSGDNVRTVLGWVATGEVDAGVVYTTDARVEPRVRVAFTFPAGSHPPVVYPGAVVRGAVNASSAAAFLAYCRGPEAAAVFAAAGFRPVGG